MSEVNITIWYRSIDGYNAKRSYKTLKAAQKYAWDRVGEHPEIGSCYAMSGDGVGRVTWDGCTPAELFPERKD